MIGQLAAQIAARLAPQFDERLLGLEQQVKAIQNQLLDAKRPETSVR